MDRDVPGIGARSRKAFVFMSERKVKMESLLELLFMRSPTTDGIRRFLVNHEFNIGLAS